MPHECGEPAPGRELDTLLRALEDPLIT
jgi:hypothetical protein